MGSERGRTPCHCNLGRPSLPSAVEITPVRLNPGYPQQALWRIALLSSARHMACWPQRYHKHGHVARNPGDMCILQWETDPSSGTPVTRRARYLAHRGPNGFEGPVFHSSLPRTRPAVCSTADVARNNSCASTADG